MRCTNNRPKASCIFNAFSLPIASAFTRTGLDIKVREFITLSILIALGGVESQIKGHATLHVSPVRLVLWPTNNTKILAIGHQRGAILDKAAEGRVDAFVFFAVEVRFGLVTDHPGQEVPGRFGPLAIPGNPDGVAADECGLPTLKAGDGGHPDICIRKRGVSHALKTGRHWHDADIALWEITGPCRSGLGRAI
jgi:hypothetical protein